MRHCFLALCACLPLAATLTAAPPVALDDVLNGENQAKGIKRQPTPKVDDLTYLRRVYIDVIGRIPTTAEIQEYLAWPEQSRRENVVDKLLADGRFADRWTVFYADMLRLRTGAEGGGRLLAFVHQCVSENKPYDEMCQSLIATNGKVGNAPEVGFILGDNADPMALAGAVSQMFMGVRIACAECHDHPFDVWTRKDFYDLAAFFGKTRRQENRFNNQILAVYTTDVETNQVMWPPEGMEQGQKRKPVTPRFPIELTGAKNAPYIARLNALRNKQDAELAKLEEKKPEASVDDLLDEAEGNLDAQLNGRKENQGVAKEAQQDARDLKIQMGRYQDSELRTELAKLVTDPRNRFFAWTIANRVWAELVGRGFVEPLDDFKAENLPSHPKTLDYLADEFVARGYDLRQLVRLIVLSDAYQRSQAITDNEVERQELEAAFLAVPMRRMLSEVLYDSIIVAGHLFEVKHPAGQNLKRVWQETRVMKQPGSQPKTAVKPQQLVGAQQPEMKQPAGEMKAESPSQPGYNVEQSLDSLDFNALLAKQDDAPEVEVMQAMSQEELEAMRMAEEMQRQQASYIERFVKVDFDDNPKFTTAMRMASPAPPEHFLRIFGQPGRTELGDFRDDLPSMRQALMMLNGRLTNEAARVGELEPMHQLLVGKKADVQKAIELAYLEILTRQPSAEELQNARVIVEGGEDLLAGMADLRWVLLNSNEFRFLP